MFRNIAFVMMFASATTRGLRPHVAVSKRRSRRQRKTPKKEVRYVQSSPTLCLPRSGVRSVKFTAQHRALIDFAGQDPLEVDTRLLSQRHDRETWMAARRSLVTTASEFHFLSCAEKRQKLLDAKLRPKPKEVTPAMKWGLSQEHVAISQYAKDSKATVYATGLWTDPAATFGASPDGIVHTKDNETGLIEVKALWSRRFQRKMTPWTKCPDRFYAQIQGQLLITDMAFCDLVAWIPRNSPRSCGPNYTVVRVFRDDTFLAALQCNLSHFADDLRRHHLLSTGGGGTSHHHLLSTVPNDDLDLAEEESLLAMPLPPPCRTPEGPRTDMTNKTC